MCSRAFDFDFRLKGETEPIQVIPKLDLAGRTRRHCSGTTLLPELLLATGRTGSDMSAGILFLQYI